MWKKINSRRIGVQMAIAWNLGFCKPFQAKYGVKISEFLVYYDGKKTDYYVQDSEYEALHARLRELIEQDEFVETAYEDTKKFLEGKLAWAQDYLPADFSHYPNEKLLETYHELTKKETEFYSRMWMVYRLGELLADYVKEKILEKTRNEGEASELMLVFATPLAPNDGVKERYSACVIAAGKKKSLEKNLEKHWQKFKYIPMFDFDHEQYTAQHFETEIKAIENPLEEAREIKQSFEERRTQFKNALKQLAPNASLRKRILFLSKIVFLRDYRDGLRQKLNLRASHLYREIAKRAGVTLYQATLMTNTEIQVFLKTGLLPDDLSEREKSYLLLQKEEKTRIYSGKKADKKAAEELESLQPNNASEVKGVVGSLGKAIGVAKIVHTNKELNKIGEGDVMIAIMTRADFVAAVRKSAALVTDEGGLTCHAAIICRELKKPCVVGTRIATSTFKDGDLVEVNANTGVVKKVNSP